MQLTLSYSVAHVATLTEGQIEQLFGPVEEMYAMLNRYEVRVGKEEQEKVSELQYAWKKLKKQSDDVGDGLVALQVPPHDPFR